MCHRSRRYRGLGGITYGVRRAQQRRVVDRSRGGGGGYGRRFRAGGRLERPSVVSLLIAFRRRGRHRSNDRRQYSRGRPRVRIGHGRQTPHHVPLRSRMIVSPGEPGCGVRAFCQVLRSSGPASGRDGVVSVPARLRPGPGRRGRTAAAVVARRFDGRLRGFGAVAATAAAAVVFGGRQDDYGRLDGRPGFRVEHVVQRDRGRRRGVLFDFLPEVVIRVFLQCDRPTERPRGARRRHH